MNNRYTNVGVLVVTLIIITAATTTSFQTAAAAVSGHPLRGETNTVDE
jgi:hypothetical protein